ncbi:MAG: aspartate aminotransferase family protein [Anaerolineaceae bacterium]|nr:aspartate aminotransferase family protein [Anaerolineaceae bacterium]MCB9099060.1 aspartate aminotransferase family protein [Anaerolineales bacterium]
MTVTEDIIELEHKYVLQTYKRPDFVLESGEGVWLYDSDGREYLDGGSGIAVNALGYQNQAIIGALRQAADSLIHVSNLYHTAPQALLARDLCENSFADRVFFSNSGAEANEGALKFARKWARTQGHTDKTGIVAFTGSFHGRTMGALACTATEKYRKPFEPLIGDVSFAQFNDLDSARRAITDKTCAVIIEPVQGEGGVTPADPAFLTGLRQICDETGALLIFDEIQCGLGRTGTLWAYEGYHVTPDMMTLAKPLAGGLPIGAILLTQNVADALGPGDHGSTFAGGPLICTVARSVFRHVNTTVFLQQVKTHGDYLAAQLNDRVVVSPLIEQVRGKGLMWGLVSAPPAAEIMVEARKHGLIVLVAGPNVVRLLPPLTISTDEIDELVDRLVKTLEAVG